METRKLRLELGLRHLVQCETKRLFDAEFGKGVYSLNEAGAEKKKGASGICTGSSPRPPSIRTGSTRLFGALSP